MGFISEIADLLFHSYSPRLHVPLDLFISQVSPMQHSPICIHFSEVPAWERAWGGAHTTIISGATSMVGGPSL